MRRGTLRRQAGLTTVEFAICGTVFLIFLFACIEMGRLLFTWNALNEATRRGARLAAVCPVTSVASVRATAAFGGSIINGFGADDIEIRYLDDNGAVVADPLANFTSIDFVQARIRDTYQFRLLIPLFQRLIPSPDFSTIMIKESLGISPPGTGTTTC